jgi:hypothetical protein
MAFILSGCLSEEEGTSFSGKSSEPPANSRPSISGNPPASIRMDSQYSFTPSANDVDGDRLTFSITGQPGWAEFDESTGRLVGTPGFGNVGDYRNIVISVDDGNLSASLAAFSISVTTDNSAPAISGNPPAQVTVGNPYSFTPTANDPDGDELTFSITGDLPWADINSETGNLSGSPMAGNVGTYAGITITVTDGTESTSLGPFSITVNAVSTGSVTLDWTPPTQNDDGSELIDLDGYRIYWGTTPGNYPNSVTLENEGLTTYVVENLAPGTYEFVATSFNKARVESAYSNPASKVVQ